MNYKEWQDFNVAGEGAKGSIAVATREDGSIVLVAIAGTKYMEERSVDILLADAEQLDALIKALSAARETLAQGKG